METENMEESVPSAMAPIVCDHALSDHEQVQMRIEIKDFEQGSMTVCYTYRCFIHPGHFGSYKVEMDL